MCVEAFGKPAVDRREKISGLGAPILVAPEPGEAHSGAQFERTGLLAPRDRQRLFEQFLRVDRHAGSAFDVKCARLQAKELRFKKTLAGPLSGLQTFADDFPGRRQLM